MKRADGRRPAACAIRVRAARAARPGFRRGASSTRRVCIRATTAAPPGTRDDPHAPSASRLMRRAPWRGTSRLRAWGGCFAAARWPSGNDRGSRRVDHVV